ncbi:hypothetical protein HHI36_020188 [Cryptolaemus montrouzieri]|uniref:Uncharacterized protein n=1 Tax=Cryptolaemus montrouzieri TaxID=559131 RepID=A0ABD2NA88_9CUCU
MDLMLKLFTQVEGIETKQNILNWLDSQQIMQSLVSMFNPNIDKDRHYNVAQLLCDFIRIARDNQRNSMERADPDPLLNTLESSEIVALLLDKILNGDKCESAIVGGIQVLLALLDVNQNSISKFNSATSYNNINDEANDMEQKQKVLNNISIALLDRVLDFHNLLLDPPKKMPMELTIGVLDPPLGQTRLQVLKLFASVISSNNNDLLQKIISLGTFPLMLDLFFKYPWNNFLHTQVERCLVLALKTYVSEDSDDTANALCKHLLENCKLIDRILGAWKENDEKQKAKGVRQGYMGHLINILNELIDSCSKTYFGQFLKENHPQTHASLEEFKENTLKAVNETQRALLGGAHPYFSNNNDSGDYSDSVVPQSAAFQQQQVYTEYQMQYLNSRFIDGYSGFNDDAFNEGGDTLQAIDHRTDMNFDLSDNALSIQVFKQLCSQSINTLDDADDQIFEEKDHTFQTVIEKQGDQNEVQVYSSDSDDESPTEDNSMDVDPWSSPKPEAKSESEPEKVMSDPWNNLSNNSSDANTDSWADFNSATFEADFSKAFENQFSTISDRGKKEQMAATSIENSNKEKDKIEGEEKAVEKVFEPETRVLNVEKDGAMDNTSITNVAQDNETSFQMCGMGEAGGDQGKETDVRNETLSNEPSKNTSSEGDCTSKEEGNILANREN